MCMLIALAPLLPPFVFFIFPVIFKNIFRLIYFFTLVYCTYIGVLHSCLLALDQLGVHTNAQGVLFGGNSLPQDSTRANRVAHAQCGPFIRIWLHWLLVALGVFKTACFGYYN